MEYSQEICVEGKERQEEDALLACRRHLPKNIDKKVTLFIAVYTHRCTLNVIFCVLVYQWKYMELGREMFCQSKWASIGPKTKPIRIWAYNIATKFPFYEFGIEYRIHNVTKRLGISSSPFAVFFLPFLFVSSKSWRKFTRSAVPVLVMGGYIFLISLFFIIFAIPNECP